MNWQNLKCEESDFAPYVSRLTSKIEAGKFGEGVTDVRDLYRDAAKNEMLIDLQDALGLNPQRPEDMTLLDQLVDDQTLIFRQSLAYKQLALAFETLAKDDESPEYDIAERYHQLYRRRANSFSGLHAPDGQATVQSISVG